MSGPAGLEPAPAGADRLAAATGALLLAVAGAVVVLGLVAATGAGTPGAVADPGPATTIGLPLARYLQALLGVLVVGWALVAVLAPEAPAVGRRALRALAPTAGALGAATAVVYLLRSSDLSGRPLPLVLSPQVQLAFVGLPQARAELLVLLAAVVLAAASRLPPAGRPLGAVGLLVLATAALLPPGFVGHSAAAADHETAVASVSVHLVAGALWVGGLAVLAVLVLADGRVPPAAALPVVRSFSTLALACVLVVGVSGVLNAALRVRPEDLLTSTYGLLLLAKTVALLVLVGLGWWHRRRSVAALERAGGAGTSAAAGRAAFVRLVVVELVVMALTVAAAVVLSRTPPPGLSGG